MKTTLLSIDFKNWRGHTGLIEFNPDRNVFSGPNGSGKTRIPDAVSWCLTGKDTKGKADSEIKSIVDGAPVQKSEHLIVLTYDIDGLPRVFSRCYYEKWSRKRGAADQTKDGNQTKFTVDGIEVTKTKYNQAIESTFGPNYFLCSDLSAVTGMEWKKRRELLISMVGIESVEFVIEPGSDFEKLLNGRTVADAKTQADQRKKTLKKSIVETNAALEERQADVDKVGGVDFEKAKLDVVLSERALSEAMVAIEKAKGGDQSGNIEKLRKLNDDLVKAEYKFEDQKTEASRQKSKNKNRIISIEDDLKNDRENLKDHQEEREKLLSEYHRIKASTAENIDGICKECGQALPENTLHLMAENFNRDKSEKLEFNMTRGKEIKAEIQRIEGIIQAKEKELSELQAVEPDPILKQESTPEIEKIKTDLGRIKMSMDGVQEIPAELTATLEACETRLKQAQETRAAVKASADSVQRLEDLKTKKAELSAENDRIEKFLSLHQQYEQALADAIEKPVNDMFQTAYFKMFDTLEKADEDGNFKQVPACIVMDKDRRPFDTALSNGERIQLQLDVARVMQKHFDIYAPIFVDNAEALTPYIKMDCQVIELRHNAELETLTKEV